MDKGQCVLLSFGRSGHTIHGYYSYGTFTQSGYESPETFDGLSKDQEMPTTGLPVVDTRAAVETEAGFKWAFRSPLPCLKGNPKPCPEISPILASGVSGGFRTMAALHTAHKGTGKKEPGPLDQVSVAEYLAGWRAHGARTGVYNGQTIVWDN